MAPPSTTMISSLRLYDYAIERTAQMSLFIEGGMMQLSPERLMEGVQSWGSQFRELENALP